jgi:hypothetical protein
MKSRPRGEKRNLTSLAHFFSVLILYRQTQLEYVFSLIFADQLFRGLEG